MNVLVIDAQGGGIGKQLVAELKRSVPRADVTAVGTNAAATAAMVRAGADRAATGENAAVVCSRGADVITGPIGIIVADALLGEITPRIAAAVGASGAVRVLIPIDRCSNVVVGVNDLNVSRLIGLAIAEISRISSEMDGADDAR